MQRNLIFTHISRRALRKKKSNFKKKNHHSRERGDLRERVQTLQSHGLTRFSSYDEKFIKVATRKTIKIGSDKSDIYIVQCPNPCSVHGLRPKVAPKI